LGHFPDKTVNRKIYFPSSEILLQIEKKIASGTRIDWLTFSGSGEPTLNSEIGILIRNIKKITEIPVAVLTNGTLLQHADVREALMAADLVVPSLDAVTQEVFEKVSRPHPSLRIEHVIDGIKKFRAEFKGQMWIEVLLVKGINDTREHLNCLKRVLDDIAPDKIQLNTVVRPPAESSARPLSRSELETVKSILGNRCEIVTDFIKKERESSIRSSEDNILAMIRRRPLSSTDLADSLGLHRDEVVKQLQLLVAQGKIRTVRHKGRLYFETRENKQEKD